MKTMICAIITLCLTTGANALTINECTERMQEGVEKFQDCLKDAETNINSVYCTDGYVMTLTQNELDSCVLRLMLFESKKSPSREEIHDVILMQDAAQEYKKALNSVNIIMEMRGRIE